MKDFYGRNEELRILEKEIALVQRNKSARLTVITGRRRVGKTMLLMKAAQKSQLPFIYLFASKVSKQELISDWIGQVKKVMNPEVVPACTRLSQVVTWIFQLARERPLLLAIDECQDINVPEPSFWSELQRDLDLYRHSSSVCIFMSGSVASAMRNIFQEYSEPLYGRVNKFVEVLPFSPFLLQTILKDYKPNFSGEDLLALYLFTGGIPWFLESLLDEGGEDLATFSEIVFTKTSPFIADGEILIANEFKGEGPVQRTLLRALASGTTKREELQSLLGETSVSGPLYRLESFFHLIKKLEPILETRFRKTRYKLTDRYLSFWFAFVQKRPDLLSQGNFLEMRNNFLKHYETFSGRALEQLFFESFSEKGAYENLGGWWDRKGENEIDLIGINKEKKEIDFFEIKRQKNKIKLPLLEAKSLVFLKNHPELSDFKKKYIALSLEDLPFSDDFFRKE